MEKKFSAYLYNYNYSLVNSQLKKKKTKKRLIWYEVHHKYKFNCSLKVTMKRSFMNALFVVKNKKITLMNYSPERHGAVAQWLASRAPNLWTRLNSRCCHVRQKFHPGHKCHSPHYNDPCCLLPLTGLGKSNVKLSHPSIIHSSEARALANHT